ncbi:MAG: hypothetical protein ACXAEU_23215, partial [Candidatus Hodarchaeales archaeon]
WDKKGGQKLSHYVNFTTEWKADVREGKINLKQVLKEAGLTERKKEELIPTYQAFLDRTRKLPYRETIGKDDDGGGASIKKGRIGVFRKGLYPGYLIMMDHTKADIWVVDNLTGVAYVRPWMSAGVDTYSHGIWSYYTTDWEHPNDAPDQETVMNCILNGIRPKKELLEWKKFERVIGPYKKGVEVESFDWTPAGLVAIIQVDNSKEFMAKSVYALCMKLNITLDFRPVKKPSYGGFVESLWDVINDEIRNEELPGRVFPIEKERKPKKKIMYKAPPKYDPQKDASMTLEEFNEWLATFVIMKLQHFPRAEEDDSPNDLWQYGMSGIHHYELGGAMKLLTEQDYKKACYEANISARGVLSDKGVRVESFYYTSKWLNNARTNKILPEGKEIDFKWSKWDRRYAWKKDPVTGKVKTLTAYKCTKGKRMQKLLEKSLGLIDNAPFPLSQKLVDYLVDYLAVLKKPTDKRLVNYLFKSAAGEIRKYGKMRKKTLKQVNMFFKASRKEPKRIEAGLAIFAGEKVSIDMLDRAGVKFEKGLRQKLLSGTANDQLDDDYVVIDEKGELILTAPEILATDRSSNEAIELLPETITIPNKKKKKKEIEEEDEIKLEPPEILPTGKR